MLLILLFIIVRMDILAMIKADKNLSMQVVRKAMKEAIAWKRRYKQYAAIFGAVFEAIEDLTAELEAA